MYAPTPPVRIASVICDDSKSPTGWACFIIWPVNALRAGSGVAVTVLFCDPLPFAPETPTPAPTKLLPRDRDEPLFLTLPELRDCPHYCIPQSSMGRE